MDFDDPPVIEVALAIQFEAAVESLDVATYGARIRSDFPKRSEQPPRPLLEERFDDLQEAPPFRLEILDRPPLSRFWFLSEDEGRLVQVQQDTFALNWRKLDASDEYPRYPALREKFIHYLGELQDVLSAEGKPDLAPNWCEVTYINHVGPDSDGNRLPLYEVLSVMREPSFRFLPGAEDAQAAARFRILEDDKPIGRLIVNANAAIRAVDRAPIWVMTLTARIRASEPNREAALSRLDLGREWVVRGFADVTTERMHQEWRMHEASTP